MAASLAVSGDEDDNLCSSEVDDKGELECVAERATGSGKNLDKRRYKIGHDVSVLNDVPAMPTDLYLRAMNSRSQLGLLRRQTQSTLKVTREWKENSVVSIHRKDKLIRVVLNKSLPFMCALCGEAFTHTGRLASHTETEHGYFQDTVQEQEEPEVRPVIIERTFASGSKEGDDTEVAPVTDALVTDNQPEVVNHLPDAGVVTSMQSPMVPPNTSQDPEGMGRDGETPTKSQKKKKMGKKGKNFVVVSTESEATFRGKRKERMRKQVSRPFCIVCGIRLKTRYMYKRHLAKSHRIFCRLGDAENAAKKLEEARRGENNGEEAWLSANGHSTGDPSNGASLHIIKCELCETYVLDVGTMVKHMRQHCGVPGVKCDICTEAVRLWNLGRVGELRGLLERMQGVDRKEEDLASSDVEFGTDGPHGPKNGEAATELNFDILKAKIYYSESAYSNVVSTCYECGELFYFTHHMISHYTKAHDKITCKMCNESLPTNGALFAHSLKNHRPGIFHCLYCERSFHEMGKFNYHISEHIGVFWCSGCGKNFLEKSALDSHLQEFADQPEHFKTIFDAFVDPSRRLHEASHCPVCGESFKKWNRMIYHLNQIHPGHNYLTGEQSFVCSLCGFVFSSNTALNTHKRTHVKKSNFQCKHEGCTKGFKTVSELKSHAKSHKPKPVRTFVCNECKKSCPSLSALKVHMKAHQKGDAFTCKLCSHMCNSHSKLLRHMRAAHKTTLKHECGVCGKWLRTPRLLQTHHAKEHGDQMKTHICEECGAAFVGANLLHQHLRTHVYRTCVLCSRSFTGQALYEEHLFKEHGITGGQQQIIISSDPIATEHLGQEVTYDSSPKTPSDIISNRQEVRAYIEVATGEEVVIAEYSNSDAANEAMAALLSELQAQPQAIELATDGQS